MLVVKGLTLEVISNKKSKTSQLMIHEYSSDFFDKRTLVSVQLSKVAAIEFYHEDSLLCIGQVNGTVIITQLAFDGKLTDQEVASG